MSEPQSQYPVQGAGLGLRRPIANKLMADPPSDIDFMEVAPENWIHVGGALGKKLRFFTERYPFLIHGLSLSIGSPAPLDEQLVRDIKVFMADHNIRLYSEHLSYCGDDGHLYDLMPIPFTEDAVKYVAGRVRRVQDILEQRIALENVSYYAPTDSSMSEKEFLLAVLEESDCDLMLDINNIVVNSINHHYDGAPSCATCRRSAFDISILPVTMLKHLICALIRTAPLSTTSHGNCWPTRTDTLARSQPYSNAISIFRQWKNYSTKFVASSSFKVTCS